MPSFLGDLPSMTVQLARLIVIAGRLPAQCPLGTTATIRRRRLLDSDHAVNTRSGSHISWPLMGRRRDSTNRRSLVDTMRTQRPVQAKLWEPLKTAVFSPPLSQAA